MLRVEHGHSHRLPAPLWCDVGHGVGTVGLCETCCVFLVINGDIHRINVTYSGKEAVFVLRGHLDGP